MSTRRYQQAFARIAAAKEAKARRRAAFIARRAQKRGMNVPTRACSERTCQHGFEQLVREVVPLAGAYLYRSSACAGCAPGRRYLYGKTAPVEQPSTIKGCDLVQSQWMVSFTPVEVGQIVTAKDPADHIDKVVV